MNREAKIFLIKNVVAMFILFGVTFIAYQDAMNGGMAWDAGSYLINNPYITSLSWENIKWMFSSFYLSNWHPLTWLSYAMDYVIYGEFWGVVLTNIIFHCANTVLVFLLTLALLNAHYCRKTIIFNNSGNHKDLLAAFVAALLFGLHPQHVESVAWMAERKDVLCQFFVLITFILYISYVRIEENRQRIVFYWAALVCFLMALLSKPMAVTLPFLLIVADIYPLQRISIIRGESWVALVRSVVKLAIEKWPFFVLSLGLMVLTLVAQTAAIAPLKNFDFQIRLLNVFKSITIYISKLLFPINLLPLYDEFPNPADPASLIPIVTFIIITALFIYLWFKRQKFWLAAWAFYLVALLPVVGIVQVGLQSSADRYAYLPTVPFYVLMGCGFATLFYWLTSIRLQVLSVLGIVVIAVSLFIMTGNQIIIWRGDFFLWKYMINVLPNHGPAHTNMASVYFNKGNYEKAIEQYEKAGALGKIFVEAFPHWALSYLKMGKLDQALQVYKTILDNRTEISPPLSCIHYNIGLIYARKASLDQARKFLLQVDLDSPEEAFIAHRFLAIIDGNQLEKDKEDIQFFTPYRYCEKYHLYTAAAAFQYQGR